MRASANVNSRISRAFGLSLALGTATLMQLSARAQEEPKLPISSHIADQKNKEMGIELDEQTCWLSDDRKTLHSKKLQIDIKAFTLTESVASPTLNKTIWSLKHSLRRSRFGARRIWHFYN